MKQFLTTLSKFGALVVFILLANYAFNSFRVNDCPTIKEKTLIIGDSHLMTAVDPSVLQDSRNLAQHAEPYLVSYFKLKKIIACNPSVKRIILGFSPHNIAGFNDEKFKDDFWSTSMFERTYPIMKSTDFEVVGFNEKKYKQVWLRKMLLFPRWNHHTYLGKFEKKGAGLTNKKVGIAIDRHYNYKGKSAGISATSKQYLDSIIVFAAQKQLDLTLVITPLHPEYIAEIPKYIKKEFTLLDQGYQKDGIRVLNYMASPIEDNFYKDYDHLSAAGAVWFSKKLQEDLD